MHLWVLLNEQNASLAAATAEVSEQDKVNWANEYRAKMAENAVMIAEFNVNTANARTLAAFQAAGHTREQAMSAMALMQAQMDQVKAQLERTLVDSAAQQQHLDRAVLNSQMLQQQMHEAA